VDIERLRQIVQHGIDGKRRVEAAGQISIPSSRVKAGDDWIPRRRGE
jgi:hypothetical protein